MRSWIPLVVATTCFIPLLAAADPAETGTPAAWRGEIRPAVKVNDHAFDRVVAQSRGCNIDFSLYFTAPEKQYSDSKNAVRNLHRFKARVRLGDHSADSPNFVNRKPGRRWYRFSFDTSAQGCWAKQEQKMWKLDVNGCRGEPCRVEPL